MFDGHGKPTRPIPSNELRQKIMRSRSNLRRILENKIHRILKPIHPNNTWFIFISVEDNPPIKLDQ